MADDNQPYGDVAYADPGYQKDGQKRYPIDTAEHVKAAWSYINQADNASKYTAEQLASIKSKIKAAGKKFDIEFESDEQQQNSDSSAKSARMPPRDHIVRGRPGIELTRAEGDDSGMPVMCGHLAVFDQWTEIESAWEGHFMERIAPGAFARTINNNRANIKVTLNHGQDPVAGDKPLGPIRDLREDETGAYYEVPLLDTSYNRDLLPGLEAGLYGASFRFRVLREQFNKRVSGSELNPDGIPERTIQEVSLDEFGPVTFPAYKTATAGVRSLTDDFIVRQLMGDPARLAQLLLHYIRDGAALPVGPEATHSDDGTRDEPSAAAKPVVPVKQFQSRESYLEWLTSRI